MFTWCSAKGTQILKILLNLAWYLGFLVGMSGISGSI